ncbi:MAG: hypothetical protein OXF98_04050 [Rhodospirillaceae bacterium]|nr:hypothetical protein [Rhodospirillaceae bacterium]
MSDCPENEALVAYLYDEGEAAERAHVERHVKTCTACAVELEGFAALRGTLREWAPPQARRGFRIVADRAAETPGAPPPSSWGFGALRPVWGLALAASTVVVVGAAIASVEVRYGDGGFMFRMGWTGSETGDEQVPDPAQPATGTQPAAAAEDVPPWRAELAALERQLLGELAAQRGDGAPAERLAPVAAVPPAPAGADLLRQVRALMAESEQRQRQEFASGLMRLAQEIDLHRQADQMRMQQEMDTLADYMVRVAQQ